MEQTENKTNKIAETFWKKGLRNRADVDRRHTVATPESVSRINNTVTHRDSRPSKKKYFTSKNRPEKVDKMPI